MGKEYRYNIVKIEFLEIAARVKWIGEFRILPMDYLTKTH